MLLDSLSVIPVPKATLVTVVAISDNPFENKEYKIPAEGGMPFTGSVFNMVDDCFEVDCVDFCHIGSISTSYKLVMNNVLCWKVNMPLPTDLILDKLSDQQKLRFQEFSNKYTHCKIHFIQMMAA